ncbi:MAG TPA: N-acetylmuramoyl-L-alanine amidase CwlD [Bacilli bacterium]
MIIWLTLRGSLKIAVSVAMVLLIIILLTYHMPSTKTWTYWTLPLSGKVIAIDAGHGGVDGGAESRGGIVEKHINLIIALHLRDYLQQAGAIVIMTREEDKDLAAPETKGFSRRKTEDLLNRVKLVKDKQANMLISIHMNSIPSSRWRGAQSFYYPSLEENKRLASSIQEEIRSNLNTDRLVGTANTIYLLKAVEIPSALIEVGFLSNPEEAQLLNDEIYQKKAAAAIYRGILKYSATEKLGSS